MTINYIRTGDYFIPDLKLQEETRPIGKWGRMHRKYLKEHHPVQFNNLVLSGNLWTYLADLNEQALQRMNTLIAQMQSAEGITEAAFKGMLAADQHDLDVIPNALVIVIRRAVMQVHRCYLLQTRFILELDKPRSQTYSSQDYIRSLSIS